MESLLHKVQSTAHEEKCIALIPKMKSISLVAQHTDYSCFPACLSSFLLDNGFSISPQEFIDKCPDAFEKGKREEGVFKPKYLPLIYEAFPIRSLPIDTPNLTIKHPIQSVFLLIQWNGNPKNEHWVRFVDRDENHVLLMNPAKKDDLDYKAVKEFDTWLRTTFLFQYVA